MRGGWGRRVDVGFISTEVGAMTIAEADGWNKDGRSIMSSEQLKRISEELERCPIILEHKHYRRSSAPSRIIFDDNENFLEYLAEKAYPGDAFGVWSYGKFCRDDNSLADGKYPDEAGRVPKRGAY